MGNICLGPSLGKHGFLQSVSAALWRTRANEDMLPSPNGAAAANPKSSSGDTDLPVQSTPPLPVQISGKLSTNADSTDKSKQSDPEKSKKGRHTKSVSSAGLQTDSVLQRKTGILKDIYTLGRKLGQGQFGITYLCLEKATGKEFACKTIGKRKLTTEEDVEDVRREIQIMHHMAGHPNIVSIENAYEDAVDVHLVMELCAGGELFDRIIERGHYTERKAAELARIIVGVVESCHSLGVMHRDLKPENFLFVDDEEDSPLKTIDFGLSVFFKPGMFLKYLFFNFDNY